MPREATSKRYLSSAPAPSSSVRRRNSTMRAHRACRVLKDAGVNVVLCNSNPATIMTDKMLADEIYLEPLTEDSLKRIIIKERPDSLLASLGGQTGLTMGCKLAKSGFLDEWGRQAHRHQIRCHR